MPKQAELLAEAQHALDDYRRLSVEAPASIDLQAVAFALGRALGSLEQPDGTREVLDKANLEIETAREALARIRKAIER
jgi:hypothetical protein